MGLIFDYDCQKSNNLIYGMLKHLNKGIYLPEEPESSLSATDIFKMFVTAWKNGCKAIYYVRTVQKDDFKDFDNTCTSCAN